MIPLSRPIIGEPEKQAVLDVLESGQLASGRRVAEFEKRFADRCQTRHGIAVGSGTAALHLGLLAAGVGAGDEVIVPSFTFAATANAVLMTGAQPVFVDIDPTTYCVSADLIEPAITERTRGVMPVHLYGHPAPMDEILALAEEHEIDVYEDAAQAHGADWRRRPVGQWGRFATFSFYPTKNMTTGEGGMVTTDDTELADRVMLLRNQGMRARYEHEVVGLNERMTEIEAALGLAQLDNLENWSKQRIENARFYDERLDSRLGIPASPELGTHVYHQYTIAPPERQKVLETLSSADIGFGVYYPTPTHRQAHYADNQTSLPVTDDLAARVVSIPVRPDLTTDERDRIVDVLNSAA